MQSAQVIPFHFEAHQVRTLLIDDQPWFVASDVATALQYLTAKDMARNLDDDEKGRQIVPTLGGDQEMTIINESGLYSAILRSRKAEAKRFKKWVTAEVLPAIRKQGRYEDHGQMRTLLGTTIGTDGFQCLGAVLDGKLHKLPAKAKQRAKMHVWSQVHKAFSVVSAQDIPAEQMDSVRNFIAAYALDGEWLAAEKAVATGMVINDQDLYLVWFALHHFKYVHGIIRSSGLLTHLRGMRSPIAGELNDHLVDGGNAAIGLLARHATEFDAVQRRLNLNQYCRQR